MLINAANLDALRAGFKTSFQGGLGQASSMHKRVATVVPSTTKEQKYGWLGKIPNVREWIGPREIQNLMQHDYAIKEKAWELTLGVDKDDIETDMAEAWRQAVSGRPGAVHLCLPEDVAAAPTIIALFGYFTSRQDCMRWRACVPLFV